MLAGAYGAEWSLGMQYDRRGGNGGSPPPAQAGGLMAVATLKHAEALAHPPLAPADGSVYVMKVNMQHQIINESEIDRWHLLCSVYDQTGYTDFPITRNEMNVVKVKAEAFKNGVKWVEGGETLFEDPTRISPTHPQDLGSST